MTEERYNQIKQAIKASYLRDLIIDPEIAEQWPLTLYLRLPLMEDVAPFIPEITLNEIRDYEIAYSKGTFEDEPEAREDRN